MATNKKPFIDRDNPALAFISSINADTDDLPEAPEPKKAAQPHKAQRKNPEQKKTHRVQLVMTEALYNAVKEQSWKEHKSLNDYVCKVLEANK